MPNSLTRSWLSDDHWNDGPPGCSSSNPCSQTYHGTGPASEPETKAMQDFAEMIGDTHQYLGAIDCKPHLAR